MRYLANSPENLLTSLIQNLNLPGTQVQYEGLPGLSGDFNSFYPSLKDAKRVEDLVNNYMKVHYRREGVL